MNKPTIPNEVADAIEELRDGHGHDNSRIIYAAMRTGGGLSKYTITLQTIPFDTLLAALVNGYEREMTAQGKLLYEYEAHLFNQGNYNTSAEDMAYADGIRYTLDTLGINIEGVNA